MELIIFFEKALFVFILVLWAVYLIIAMIVRYKKCICGVQQHKYLKTATYLHRYVFMVLQVALTAYQLTPYGTLSGIQTTLLFAAIPLTLVAFEFMKSVIVSMIAYLVGQEVFIVILEIEDDQVMFCTTFRGKALCRNTIAKKNFAGFELNIGDVLAAKVSCICVKDEGFIHVKLLK